MIAGIGRTHMFGLFLKRTTPQTVRCSGLERAMQNIFWA